MTWGLSEALASESKCSNSTVHPKQVQKFNIAATSIPENSKVFKLEIFAIGTHMNQKTAIKHGGQINMNPENLNQDNRHSAS